MTFGVRSEALATSVAEELEKLAAEKAQVDKGLKDLEAQHQAAKERCKAVEGQVEAAGSASKRLVGVLQKLKKDVNQMQALLDIRALDTYCIWNSCNINE